MAKRKVKVEVNQGDADGCARFYREPRIASQALPKVEYVALSRPQPLRAELCLVAVGEKRWLVLDI